MSTDLITSSITAKIEPESSITIQSRENIGLVQGYSGKPRSRRNLKFLNERMEGNLESLENRPRERIRLLLDSDSAGTRSIISNSMRLGPRRGCVSSQI